MVYFFRLIIRREFANTKEKILLPKIDETKKRIKLKSIRVKVNRGDDVTIVR